MSVKGFGLITSRSPPSNTSSFAFIAITPFVTVNSSCSPLIVFLERVVCPLYNITFCVIKGDVSYMNWQHKSKRLFAVDLNQLNFVSIINLQTLHLLSVHRNKNSFVIPFSMVYSEMYSSTSIMSPLPWKK